MEQASPSRGKRVFSDEEIRDEISAIVLPFSAGQLATASGRTKEQAKKVKQGYTAPNAATLINWACNIPVVNDWLMAKIAANGTRPETNPQMLVEVLTQLRRMSETDTTEGRALKQIFRQVARGPE